METSGEICQLCGGELQAPSWRPRSSYDQAGRYRIDVCARCGAGTTMPRPTPAELDACYGASYGYGAHQLIEGEKRFRSANLVRRAGVTTGRVLDVGCMFGFLLDEARRAGLETWGVELSEAAAATATANGHRVTRGTLDDHLAAHPEVRFDAIFAQHVLEHLPDPAGFFATCMRLLLPGGRVIVGVPNFEARLRRLAPEAWGWYQVPVHLHHFTPASLRQLIDDAGLVLEDQRTYGGDTLFLALTALNSAQRPAPTTGNGSGGLARWALSAAGRALRPYYHVGDDELVMVARRPS